MHQQFTQYLRKTIMADRPKLTLRVGVLAIQGAFFEHRASLLRAKKALSSKIQVELEILDIRIPEQLNDLDGLILPGGESTTMSIFLKSNNFEEVLKEWVRSRASNRMVWGTCAGLILLSNEIEGQKIGGQTKLGGLDVTTSRNYFGRQVDSFEAIVDLKDSFLDGYGMTNDNGITKPNCWGVFIRAPAVLSVDSPKVTVLGTVQTPEKEQPVVVAVKQGNIMATAFHPELTEDPRWHGFFLNCLLKNKLS